MCENAFDALILPMSMYQEHACQKCSKCVEIGKCDSSILIFEVRHLVKYFYTLIYPPELSQILN